MNETRIVLSEAQRRAVQWEEGPLLVLAGPGAGKTEVLAERAVRVIQATPKRRFRVMGLTFTELAAREMKQRVTRRLGRESDRARIATFQSFCAGVLSQHGSHLGLRPDFEILEQDGDRARVLGEALGSRAPWGSQPLPAERIARNLDRLFRADPESRAASRRDEGVESGWDKDLLEAYVSKLIEQNCMDCGSLLLCCFRLMRRQPRIAADFPIVYPHVLVDEYQDSNAIQDRLLRELWPPGSAELFVAADDDQTIYQWNGASPERIENLRTDYALTVVELPESFRCPTSIVHRANRLMAAGRSASESKVPLAAAGSDAESGSVRVRSFSTEAEEVAWAAEDIRNRDIASGECAILARNGRLVEAAFKAVRSADIRAWCRRPRDEFVSPGIRWVLAGLRLANAPRDGAQLRLLGKALLELSGVSVPPAAVEAEAEVENGALLAAFVESTREPSGSPLADDLLRVARRHLVERPDHRRFARETLDLLEADLAQTGDPAVRNEARDEMELWGSLSAEIRKHGGDDMPLSGFLHELDLRPIVAEPKGDEVRCLTIHQAKGKEFRHVYLIGVAEDLLPSYHAKKNGENGAQIEEERRNCFVAITRASETLTLTCAQSYYGWPKKPSRFLADMRLLPIGGNDRERQRDMASVVTERTSLGGFARNSETEDGMKKDDSRISEQDRIVERLEHSNSFSQTHHAISELGQHFPFKGENVGRLVNALLDNEQVEWISDDADVKSFFRKLAKDHGDAIPEPLKVRFLAVYPEFRPPLEDGDLAPF